jgi:LysR family transcriptional regulator (chromosome initiation inhibitor)
VLILRSPTLVAFEAIARIGTVHGAAKELSFTQTALTLRLKQLESQLAMTLFLRSRRGMALTSEGKALYQLCKGQRELEGQFLSQVSGHSRQMISLTIAGPASAISTRVADQIAGLYQRYPFLSLHLRVDDHSDLVELIRRGEADLAVVPPTQVPDEMDSKVLKADRYMLVASKKWKGKKLQPILESERLIDFYESDSTSDRYLKTFEFVRNTALPRLFANNNEALVRLVSAGVGYATLTETVAKPYLDSGEIVVLNNGKAMNDALALIWYPRPAKQEYFESLLKAIK